MTPLNRFARLNKHLKNALRGGGESVHAFTSLLKALCTAR